MTSLKNLKLGDLIRTDGDKLKDLPNDDGNSSIHLSLNGSGKLSVCTEVQGENELGEPEVQKNNDAILQASNFEQFITKLRNGIVDQETSYNMNDVVNLILELACICQGSTAMSRKSCEDVAEEGEEEPES